MKVKIHSQRGNDLSVTASLFCDGNWIESKDQDELGSVRLIQLADIGDGFFINKSNRHMNIETAKKLNCTFLCKGDILIARMPDPLGRCCIFPFNEYEKYVTVVDIAILRVKSNIDNSYVRHIINTSQVRHKIYEQSTGTTRTRITRKKLQKLQVPLPPLPEQQKIASILDVADSLRQKDQQLIEKYTALSQSLFFEMFGDYFKQKICFREIREVANFIDYRGKTPESTSYGVPLISAKSVRQGFFDKSRLNFISKEIYKKIMTRGFPKINDVLFTTEGATMGYTCRIPKGLD